MPTLYLRNVPESVLERLERLATAERSSVSAVAVRELDQVTRRADNSRLLGALPDTGVVLDAIVGSVDDGRASRLSCSMPLLRGPRCSGDGAARAVLAEQQVHAPHLVDAEVGHVPVSARRGS